MRKLPTKALCLILLAGLFGPLAVRAQDGGLPCENGDNECQAQEYIRALAILLNGVENTNAAFGDYLAYLSTRFSADLRFDGNGQDVLRGLYPSLARLIEQDVSAKHGLSLPLKPPGTSSNGLGRIIAPAVGAIGLAVYLDDLFDHRLDEVFIEAMAQDIRRRGWSLDSARMEANHQFTTYIQSITSFVPITADSVRDIRIIVNQDYYLAWQAFTRTERPEVLQPRGGPRQFPAVGEGPPSSFFFGGKPPPNEVAVPCFIYYPSTGWIRCPPT
jgi:hypothetical protein